MCSRGRLKGTEDSNKVAVLKTTPQISGEMLHLAIGQTATIGLNTFLFH